MKVLVIEDQPTELKLTDHVLSAAGYSVNGAGASAEAFASILIDRPEIILLDMHLPGMNGLDLVRKLKSNPTTKGILVVAMTSFPERYPRKLALEAGCDAYLLKPLSTRTLPSELETIIAIDRSAGL